MAREFKETARFNTDLKKLHDNWDQIDWGKKESKVKEIKPISEFEKIMQENMTKTRFYEFPDYIITTHNKELWTVMENCKRSAQEAHDQIIKEANEVIGFYADTLSWGFDDCTLDYSEIDSSDFELIHPVSKQRSHSETGGKRAREYLAKHA